MATLQSPAELEDGLTFKRNGCAFAPLCVFLFLVLAGCAPAAATDSTYCSPSDQKAPQPAAWLRDNAVPFDDSTEGWRDLLPLKQMIGDARVVALGEATHGTGEFFQTKRRILEFLVEEMGFNALAMEVNAPEAERINAYVQHGAGDPAQLLGGLNVWPWNTHEFLETIEWMRAYDETGGQSTALSFSGFDMQLPRASIDNILQYVRQVDPSNTRTESELACYRQYQDATFAYSNVDAATRKKCHDGLLQAYDDLEQQRARYETASSADEYDRVLHDARLVLQAEERYSTLANRDQRDAFMAENVKWIVERAGPQSKVVLWAHNTHVDTALPMTRSMGAFLRETLGSQLVSVGFSFYAGSFNAMTLDSTRNRYGNIAVQSAAPPPDNSYEAYFHSIDLPRFVLDLRKVTADENAETAWMMGPHPFRSIGTSYDPSRPLDYCYDARLPDEFDIIVYFDDTAPSELLGK